jgi:paraquat-inducible protein B
LCGWFVYHDYVASGPLITLFFENVEGLEEQNTPVKYRGAEIGRVKMLRLTDNARQVVVKARLAGSAKNLARAGSLFWIVRPEVKIGAISGLRTLVSGEYIAIQPGDGQRTNVFQGSEKPPPSEESIGLEIALLSSNLGSLQDQSPVYYRGIQVGEVLNYQLGPDSRAVIIRAAIRKEYAPLVRWNSKFWNAGGLNVHVGLLKGVEVSAESAKTLLSGAIEFATPPEPESAAGPGAAFQLYDKPEDSWKKWAPAIKLNLPEAAPELPRQSPLSPQAEQPGNR